VVAVLVPFIEELDKRFFRCFIGMVKLSIRL